MALKMPTKAVSNSPLGRVMGGNHHSARFLELLPRQLTHEGVVLEHHIREGRFQRSLSFIAAFSSLMSGLEVTYEHYRGSYSQPIMYTPVLLSLALFIAGVWAVFSRWAARILLPIVSLLTIIDGVVGFIFHALAARTSDYLISNSVDVLTRHPGIVAVTTPPVRHNLSPAGTSWRGVPRIK